MKLVIKSILLFKMARIVDPEKPPVTLLYKGLV